MRVDAPGASSPENIRRHNLATLLRLLHIHGAASRAALTASTGLNRSTVKALVTELVELGLVHESTPAGTGAAGRPSIMVAPASDQVFTVAVDVGVEHLAAARVGLGGVLLERQVVELSGEQDPDLLVSRSAQMIGQLLRAAPPGALCVGIGVAVPGLVGADEGVVRSAPNLGWVDVPLGRLLRARVGRSLTVSVGNEADLGATAEQVRGAAAGLVDVVYIAGEVGVGGGIIVGGRPLMGAGGYAGEIGHMMVNPRGKRCGCGARGCWETEIGEHAILTATKSPPGTTLADVRAAFDAGDRTTRSGVRHIGQWLGTGVVTIVNIFNPQVVIFGGRSREIFAAAEPYVREMLHSALPASRDGVRLELSGLGGESSLLGAAELAFEPLLSSPADVAARSGRPAGPAPARPPLLAGGNGRAAAAARSSAVRR